MELRKNILRYFSDFNCKVTIVPCKTGAEDILKLKPSGIFLSNGPGDPAGNREICNTDYSKINQKKLPFLEFVWVYQILALHLVLRQQK